MTSKPRLINGIGDYKWGFRDPESYIFKSRQGLDREVVEQISHMKGEPEWMLEFRLKAFEHYQQRPLPTWGGDVLSLDLDNIYYYIKPTDKEGQSWDDIPDAIKDTFDKLGIPEAEQKFLAGVGAQYESEMVYHNIQDHLEEQGVIFLSIEEGLRQHPDLFREYFSKAVPIEDNKFAALNSAVWSGGSFVYIPPGVKVDLPLQAYFRLNAENIGQFERSIIIADEGSQMHYVEGCTAPQYTTDALHSGVIEIVVKKNARVRYTTIQNWSTNVYNLVTQRAIVEDGGTMEWVDANMGCLAEGSTVTTPFGVMPIEEIEVGDEVLSLDESTGEFYFRPVVAKRFSGYQPVREISYGERRLLATSNHPFYSFDYLPHRAKKLGRYKLDYVRADELTEAIIPRTSIDYGHSYILEQPVLETTFETSNQYAANLEVIRTRPKRLAKIEETTDELMWLFGLFLGDGNIRRESGESVNTRWAKVGFSVPQNNRARSKLVVIMDEIIDADPGERPDGVYIVWNSVELADLFEMNGFTGNARTKRIPGWVFSLPESQRLSLLAGYIDSDGCAIASKRRFSIKSVNRDLLQDVAALATTLGMTSRVYTEHEEFREVIIKGIPCTSHGSHRIEIPLDERLLPYLSDRMRGKVESIQPAKLQHHRNIGHSNIELSDTLEVVKVSVGEPCLQEVPTWDIEVGGTGNFVSEGFIVHNSKLTMKYPSCYLMGPGAHGEILSMAFAGEGQHHDTGGKMIHLAPHTSSKIVSKSISKDGGRASYRGLLKVTKNAVDVRSNVVCDALLLDGESRSDTYPYIEIDNKEVNVGHEASVSKMDEEQLFYLKSRGLSDEEATMMVVSGFIEPLVKELPMEYAIEMNRLIQLQMEGSVG